MALKTHDRFYSVSEAARQFGVSSDTIRRYEEEGIFQARRVLNNHRGLDAENIEAIKAHRQRIRARGRCTKG
jgi:DNA-binding transcriptional MerR regulator